MAVDVPPGLPRGWWVQEALGHDPGEACPPLAQDLTADVVILGGGYTGMWTAYFLKEHEPDLDIVLLEQDICGGGPSGRNGGFLDGWWKHVTDLIRTFGEGDAIELMMAAGPGPSEIGAWCQRHGVDAWFQHGGGLAVATSPASEGRWQSTIEAGRQLGVEDKYQVLTPEEVRKRCESPMFGGGML